MKYLALLLLLLVSPVSSSLAGPIFPTRGFLLHPTWSAPTDTTSVFDHGGFWAQVQRGFGSDSDRWGWSIMMGAVLEFARWHGTQSLFAFTGMELLADTHNDISFNPHGADWEEGLVYAVHESEGFDWQLGTIYRCRHDIDNGDPEQYSDLGGQRTLIYCSLSAKAIWHTPTLFGFTMPLDAWLRADAYLIREDYRLPYVDKGIGTDYNHLAWTLGPAFQTKLAEWRSSAIYLMGSLDLSAFGAESGFLRRFTTTPTFVIDSHDEVGYEFHGRAGRLQLYAGYELWQDDGQTPIPRNTSFGMIGFRFSGVDAVRF